MRKLYYLLRHVISMILVVISSRMRSKVKIGTSFVLANKPWISSGLSVEIGSNVYIGRNVHIGTDLIVGNHVMIASEVAFVGGDHSIELTDKPMKYSNRPIRKGIVVGNDVWIGHRAILLDGIKIHEGAVIAAGSVVTKNVEGFSVYAGVPAKYLKKRSHAPNPSIS